MLLSLEHICGLYFFRCGLITHFQQEDGTGWEKIEKLVVAQDIGGAIKGAVRGDYFWGSGKDDVLDYAGRMNSAGRYFIMLPKKTETRN